MISTETLPSTISPFWTVSLTKVNTWQHHTWKRWVGQLIFDFYCVIFKESCLRWMPQSPQWQLHPQQPCPTPAFRESLYVDHMTSVCPRTKSVTSELTALMALMKNTAVKCFFSISLYFFLPSHFLALILVAPLSFYSWEAVWFWRRRHLWLDACRPFFSTKPRVPLVTWSRGKYSRWRTIPSTNKWSHFVSTRSQTRGLMCL